MKGIEPACDLAAESTMLTLWKHHGRCAIIVDQSPGHYIALTVKTKSGRHLSNVLVGRMPK